MVDNEVNGYGSGWIDVFPLEFPLSEAPIVMLSLRVPMRDRRESSLGTPDLASRISMRCHRESLLGLHNLSSRRLVSQPGGSIERDIWVE